MLKEPSSKPLGFLRLAKEYLEAATMVQAPPEGAREAMAARFSLPAYFLVCRSIELALKAFLCSRGVSTERLRRRSEFGHSLGKLSSESRRRRLGLIIRLSKQEVAWLNLLSESYSEKAFEYLDGDALVLRVPPYGPLHDLACRLISALHTLCRQTAFGRPPRSAKQPKVLLLGVPV